MPQDKNIKQKVDNTFVKTNLPNLFFNPEQIQRNKDNKGTLKKIDKMPVKPLTKNDVKAFIKLIDPTGVTNYPDLYKSISTGKDIPLQILESIPQPMLSGGFKFLSRVSAINSANNEADNKLFKNGGDLASLLGSTAGMALGSIIAPGVGTSIGGMLGNKAGNFVSNQFEMGGNLTEYTGNTHENGGIPIGQSEVEDGETNHQGYIFSDTLKLGDKTFADMSKKINNKYSKRPDDKLSKDSKQRELGNLMKVQESTGMTNQGNKMWSGGWIKNINSLTNQANDFSNYTPDTATGPLATPTQQSNGFYTSDDMNSNKDAVGNITNTLITQPINKEVIQEAIEDERTRVGLQTTSPTLNKAVVPPSALPKVLDGTKPLQTEVNSLGYIASNVGPAFDLLQGLKGGDDVQFDRVKQTYANPNPAITSLDNTTSTSFNNVRNAIRNNASSSGEYLAMMNSLSGSESLKRGLGKASIKSEYDKINSGTANQISAQNANTQRAESTARQQETDAVRSTMSQGLHNFGQNTLGYQADLEANKTQNKMFPLLSDKYEYVEDKDGNIKAVRKTTKSKSNSNYNVSNPE